MPTLLQYGIILLCIPSAVCIAKWKAISNDPRVILIILAIINGWIIAFVGTALGSKLFTTSESLLKNLLRVKPPGVLHKYLIKKIYSKQPMAVKVSDSFIDSEMPLNVALFCFSNIVSLLMIFKKAKEY